MKIILLLLVFCSSAFAGDLPDLGEPKLGRYEFTKGQVVAETAYMALLYADYRQTMDIKGWCARRHDGEDPGPFTWNTANDDTCPMSEVNPLLGRHPSDARIRNYFLLSAVTHVAITKALPSEYRPYWQGAGIIWQLAFVIRNKRLGLQYNF